MAGSHRTVSPSQPSEGLVRQRAARGCPAKRLAKDRNVMAVPIARRPKMSIDHVSKLSCAWGLGMGSRERAGATEPGIRAIQG